jgi:acetyl esterase/lipase
VPTRLTLALLLTCYASPLLAQQAEPEISKQLEVVYGQGGSQSLHLDLARPTGAGPFPAVVAIHGGSWRSGNKAMFRPLLDRLAKRGFVAIAIQYRLAPQHRWPAQLEDAKCAVRWLRAHANRLRIDPQRIGAVGFSAGAHLALLLGSVDAKRGFEGQGGHAGYSSKVQAVIDFFGPTDLRGFRGRTMEDFLGGSNEELPERYAEASPILSYKAGDAPVLLIHGTLDRLVPLEQSVKMARRLTVLGVRNSLVTVEQEGHGWFGPKLDRNIEQSLSFLDAVLRQRSAKPRLY